MLWYWHIYSRNFEIRICGWWTISLHVKNPRRRAIISDSKGLEKLWRKSPRFNVFFFYLVFHSLKIYFTVFRKLLTFLMLKKCIMQNIIIYFYFSHFRLNPFSHSLLQAFVCIIWFMTKFIDACIFNEIRKLERFFLNSSFILKISPFLTPMLRHRNSISYLFYFYQKKRIRSCYIPVFNKVWPCRFHFEVKYTYSLNLLSFLPWEILLNFSLILILIKIILLILYFYFY